ncbi:MAG: rhamnulokinase family protein [Chloroherpetonaceae bacterium]|nr:rhamnulokinase [Chthonomonadaceae bacterium]MDW8206286.1 rhamnulokinase family protein [Chloroherpetonaceae bacterium]
MAEEVKFLAFDLGAESGRGVIGFFDGTRLRLEEVHRFPNGPVRAGDTLYWDVLRLFSEIRQGLGQAVARSGRDLAGVGIDTWGVDFGLLGRDDRLLGNPRHYRDHGNDGILEEAFAVVPREQIFERTGIQFLQFNTLFQLLALRRMGSPLLDVAQTLLFMPDLLNFWLTGVKVSEFSIASTSQMLDPRQRRWATDLLEAFGLPTHILTEILAPGSAIGPLRSDIAAECGCHGLTVFAPAEHDTGSAVVAVPATDADSAYISSGTWSLMGIELPEPRISEATRNANFTNEGGACGTIRLLKNIMGLWLVQSCRRVWARQGQEYDYSELTEQAAAAPSFGPVLEPDDVSFLAPDDMTAAIDAFCRRTGQTPPQGIGATVRCCLESLALKYRWVLEQLEAFRGQQITTIHIVGGGTQNRLLCQLTADATGRPVVAGPVEATAIGNILMQAMGRGHIRSLDEARQVVRNSCPLQTYEPAAHRDAWDAAYARYLELRAATGNAQT